MFSLHTHVITHMDIKTLHEASGVGEEKAD